MSDQPKKDNSKKLAIIIAAAALIIGIAIYASSYAGKPSTLSFTYAPIDQLKVDSVQSSVCQDCATVDDNGVSYVEFTVTLQNIGDSPIYFQAGSSLPVSVSANSTVLQASPLFCLSNAALIPLEPSQNYTTSFAGCTPGYYYQVAQAGTVKVTFDLNWTTEAPTWGAGASSNVTTVSADLHFA
jgi:hypothetical protein